MNITGSLKIDDISFSFNKNTNDDIFKATNHVHDAVFDQPKCLSPPLIPKNAIMNRERDNL